MWQSRSIDVARGVPEAAPVKKKAAKLAAKRLAGREVARLRASVRITSASHQRIRTRRRGARS
jgi:hypothetical protein